MTTTTTAAPVPVTETAAARGLFAERSRWRWQEVAYWLIAAGSIVAFPTHLVLIAQVLITGLFALSFDLLVGYAGIGSLGHAAFFGIGAYTAGIVARNGWGEPITGLLIAGLMAGAVGFLLSTLVARLTGIALLMITFGVGLLIFEGAHSMKWLTNGDDGLSGINMWPVLGKFEFDFLGRTAVIYALVVAFVLFLIARRIVNSPFGLQLKGMRENIRRVPALGISVRYRYMAVFTISAIIAGIAGGLLAQITQTVALPVLGFDRSASVLIMVMLGGMGSLIGAMIGAAVYMIAQDRLSSLNPVYWNFWLGLFLVVAVLFARGGLMAAFDRIEAAIRRRRGRTSQ
jgi:branched-chain amino acid transport system permease protein